MTSPEDQSFDYYESDIATDDSPNRETIEMPRQSLRRRLGGLLMRGRRTEEAEVDLDLDVADAVEDAIPTDELAKPEEGIGRHEKELAVSEIAMKTRALVTDESILTGKSDAQALLTKTPVPDSFDRKATIAYYRLKDVAEMSRIGEYPRRVMLSSDEKFKEVQGAMLDGPKMERGSWFQPPKDITRSALVKTIDEPIKVPVSNIVYASGFESWQGRGINGSGEKTREHDGLKGTSAEAIDMYARLETPQKPVEGVTAFVQPNGLTFYRVDGGEHRAAAALRRGEEYLDTSELWIKNTDHDYFPLPETEGQAK